MCEFCRAFLRQNGITANEAAQPLEKKVNPPLLADCADWNEAYAPIDIETGGSVRE